jgi:hypothetical protein
VKLAGEEAAKVPAEDVAARSSARVSLVSVRLREVVLGLPSMPPPAYDESVLICTGNKIVNARRLNKTTDEIPTKRLFLL